MASISDEGARSPGLVGGRLRKKLAFGEDGDKGPLSFEKPRRGAKVIGEGIIGDGIGVSKVEELPDDGAAGAVEGREDLGRGPDEPLGRRPSVKSEGRLAPSVEGPTREGLLERRLLETFRELREARLTDVAGLARRPTEFTALVSILKHSSANASTSDRRCVDGAGLEGTASEAFRVCRMTEEETMAKSFGMSSKCGSIGIPSLVRGGNFRARWRSDCMICNLQMIFRDRKTGMAGHLCSPVVSIRYIYVSTIRWRNARYLNDIIYHCRFVLRVR